MGRISFPFTTPVKGCSYRQDVVREAHTGELVAVRHDPTNPHDANAMVVETANGVILGYLPKELAARVVTRGGMGTTMYGYIDNVAREDVVRVSIVVERAKRGPLKSAGVRRTVRAKSGRELGELVRHDGDRIVVRDSADRESAYSADVVIIATTRLGESDSAA